MDKENRKFAAEVCRALEEWSLVALDLHFDKMKVRLKGRGSETNLLVGLLEVCRVADRSEGYKNKKSDCSNIEHRRFL